MLLTMRCPLVLLEEVLIRLKSKETKMDVLSLGQFNLPDGVTHFDLDTPLKDILPYAELNEADKARGELMTARMILSH
jgi:hypothetical protein